MINTDGSPNTAHTTNKVPCFIINSQYQSTDGGLCDIAPTILKCENRLPEGNDWKSIITLAS